MADDRSSQEVINSGEKDKVLKEEADKADRIRLTLANVYTFVRSREINRSIASYTLDHYIEEAMLKLKGDGDSLRDASGKTKDADGRLIGSRPTQLEALATLESDFKAAFEKMKGLAEKLDADAEKNK